MGGRDWVIFVGLTCELMGGLLGMPADALPSPNRRLAQTTELNPSTPNPSAEADRLFQTGLDHFYANRLEAALDPWQTALKQYQILGNTAAVASTLQNLSTVYQQLGRSDAAIATYEQLLPIAQQLQNPALVADTQYNLATLYAKQGRYAAALEPYQASLRYAQAQAPERVPIVLGNLAIAYKVAGQYVKALEANQALIQLLEQRNENNLLSRALGNLGNVYEALGDYDLARQQFDRGRQLAEAEGNRLGEAIFWNSLGTLAANQGDYPQAIAHYEHSLSLAQKLNDLTQQAWIWLNLGAAYHAQGQLPQAMSYYRKGLYAAEDLGHQKLLAESLGRLGAIQNHQRQPQEAVGILRRSLTVFEEMGDRPGISLTLNNLGHALYTAGQLDEAEQRLRQALQVLDQLRQGLSDLDKVSLFDTQARTYNLLQQVLIAQQKPETALEVAEWGRGRAFADLLVSKQKLQTTEDVAIAPPTVPPPNLAELRQVAQAQKATIVEYTLIPEDDFLHQGKQLGIPEALFIWVITPSGQIYHRKTNLKPLIQEQRSLDQLIQRARCFDPEPICRRRVQDRSAPNATPALQRLHQLLIEPIADLLPQHPDQHVLFVPQGSLFLVPFPALKAANGEFLIERHTLLTAPSIQSLALTQPHKILAKPKAHPVSPTLSPILIVGNPVMPAVALRPDRPPQPLAPLPGSETEALAIAQRLHVQPLIGAVATEAEVRKRLPQARWIHLATHGLLDYGVSRSGLAQPGIPGAIALASSGSDPAQDGLLTSNEIIDLDLHADLVVLSACDTGQGELTGDGVVGLARAWMGAGAPSVVVSLWAVSDTSTAVLMTEFYRHLSEGQDKAQALRQAMLSTAQTYPDPHDWAAFTLVGAAE